MNMLSDMTVRELYELTIDGSDMEKDQVEYVSLQGWIRTNRFGKNVSFISLNDGTYFKNAQIVYSDTLANYAEIGKLLTGAAVSVTGKYLATPENKQPFEIQATEIVIEGLCDSTYPLQKKRHTFEYLREIGHLRPRTNTLSAVFRVRSALAMAIHEFFQDQGFVYLNLPVEDSDDIYTAAFASAYRDVYTFGPKKTPDRELWYITSRIAFAEPEDVLSLMEDFCRSCTDYLLENCEEELKYFAFVHDGLQDRLDGLQKDYIRCSSGCSPEPSVPYFAVNEPAGTADLFVPGFGKLCSGTPDTLDTDKTEIRDDLRRYGGMESGGFVLTLEDYVMMVTGITSLDDVIPFPAGQKRE